MGLRCCGRLFFLIKIKVIKYRVNCFVDLFTKFVTAVPAKNQTAQTVADIFSEKLVLQYGISIKRYQPILDNVLEMTIPQIKPEELDGKLANMDVLVF